jgi:hypothetical protein
MFPFTLLTDAGAHDGRSLAFFPAVFISSLLNSIFNRKNKLKMENGSNGNEKLQIIYRWKALTEENPLKQFILKMEHCTTLASKGKGFGLRTQLDDLTSNWTN